MAPDVPDTFVPDTQVKQELGNISDTTLGRWTNDKTLGFPPIIKVFTRNYRSRKLLEEFKQRMLTRKLPHTPPPGSYRKAGQRKQKRRA